MAQIEVSLIVISLNVISVIYNIQHLNLIIAIASDYMSGNMANEPRGL